VGLALASRNRKELLSVRSHAESDSEVPLPAAASMLVSVLMGGAALCRRTAIG